MKIQKTPNGIVVLGQTEGVDVIYAGLAGLVEYYGNVSPTGPYMQRAWMMTEAYLSMLSDIKARGGQQAYYDEVISVLKRLEADRRASGGVPDGG